MLLPLIAVLRGGYSGESVISLQSAARMMGAIDRTRYEACYVTIEREQWTAFDPDGRAMPFDRGKFAVLRDNAEGVKGWQRINAALIAIHGEPGENGKLQGYLDMLGVPYQTGGVLSMALSFSKYATTALLRQQGFEVCPSVMLFRGDEKAAEKVAAIGYPCFVKPDQSGSSLGVTKVKRPEDLAAALELAFAEGGQVMVEAAVSGRELTCGVIDLDGGARALPVCEIRHSHEFFDYQAKYHATDTQELVPAPLPDEVTLLVQERSAAIYTALECRGMVRVDHFWTGERLVTIEVNATPGFSGASIFPKMLEVSGIGVEPAINGLIARMLA